MRNSISTALALLLILFTFKSGEATHIKLFASSVEAAGNFGEILAAKKKQAAMPVRAALTPIDGSLFPPIRQSEFEKKYAPHAAGGTGSALVGVITLTALRANHNLSFAASSGLIAGMAGLGILAGSQNVPVGFIVGGATGWIVGAMLQHVRQSARTMVGSVGVLALAGAVLNHHLISN